ncbi:hypothetical protein L6452_31452 [Arctium lappa]|uniref:Uncharacterized protein n=1 Tax=Arctium lappa TaxID=4217 RepID=A0ACB8Z1H5_ARCLA|nr:hypothetical protein L6452_31452 [Arctium lappa]
MGGDGGGSGGDGGEGDEKLEMVCGWCQKPISDDFTYSCIKCRYFVHKYCTLLKDVSHPYHHRHPLSLTVGSESWFCDVCDDQGLVWGFRYRCDLCDFDACTKCGVAAALLKDAASIKFEHEGHPQHTLTLQLRPAAFRCDACKTEDKDLFYQCNDCTFWIHKTCATLARNIHLPHHHHHDLLLAYSLPENFYNFVYFYQQPFTSRDDPGTSNAQEQSNDHDLIKFPMSKAFTNPLRQLNFEKTTLDDDGATEINHWSHHHPLILNVEPQGNAMLAIDHHDPIVVCYGCVRSLTFPYYSCKYGCKFFLHKYCVQLPRTLKHKLHANHPLDLINYGPKDSFYQCSGCFLYGNIFVYTCKTCKFYLDVNCAFLPQIIKHESHKHPLSQDIDLETRCNACFDWFDGIYYSCRACDFQLDLLCAMRSPYSLAHRYCKGHEVPLIYPPIEDHLEDFYCTICETEIHPKYWLYHCQECDNSFHLGCIGKSDLSENRILEGTQIVSYHKHPLRYVRRKKTPRYVCFGCNLDINDHLILECQTGTCPFKICVQCDVAIREKTDEHLINENVWTKNIKEVVNKSNGTWGMMPRGGRIGPSAAPSLSWSGGASGGLAMQLCLCNPTPCGSPPS